MSQQRRLLVAVVVLGLWGMLPVQARGSEWGTVVPGTSTTATVQAQFGAASRTSASQLEGYDTIQWVYEGAQAPVGMQRMTVDFGLLTPSGYRPELVRTFRLDPKPGVFTRQTILIGWGAPTRTGRDVEVPIFYYEEGLLVYFDAAGWLAERMVFTPGQQHLKK